MVTLARNLVHHNVLMHIKVQYHFVQECVGLREIIFGEDLYGQKCCGWNEEVPFSRPVSGLERTYGYEADLREVATRSKIVIKLASRIVPGVLRISLYFHFCEYAHYGGVLKVVSNGHLHTRHPFGLFV